jgi:hypothetical protein
MVLAITTVVTLGLSDSASDCDSLEVRRREEVDLTKGRPDKLSLWSLLVVSLLVVCDKVSDEVSMVEIGASLDVMVALAYWRLTCRGK